MNIGKINDLIINNNGARDSELLKKAVSDIRDMKDNVNNFETSGEFEDISITVLRAELLELSKAIDTMLVKHITGVKENLEPDEKDFLNLMGRMFDKM